MQRLLAALALTATTFLVTLLPPAAAQAAPRTLAVWRLEFQPPMAANNEEFLRGSLMEGLANNDFQVFGALTVSELLKQGSRLENCRQDSCYQEIARSLGVEYLITGVIAVDRKNYDITLELINGRDGKSIDQYKELCQLCGIKEVATKLQQLVRAVRQGADSAAAAAPARYSVESRPAGAEVLVDGRAAGMTPLNLDLPAGAHKVTIRALGYESSERALNVESGTSGVVAVDLAPAGTVAGHGGPSRMLAWSAMALGAVAIGVGFVVLNYHNQFLECVDPPGAGKASCLQAKVRPTELESGILFGAGGALILSGATTLFLSPSEAPGAGRVSWVGGLRGKF